MMNSVTLQEAQNRLPELLAELRPGEAVQITEDERVVARLVSEAETARQPRQPGSAISSLTILADDEEHLQDFSDYMP